VLTECSEVRRLSTSKSACFPSWLKSNRSSCRNTSDPVADPPQVYSTWRIALQPDRQTPCLP